MDMDRGTWWVIVHEVTKESDTTKQQQGLVGAGVYRGLSSSEADCLQDGRPRRKSIKLEMSRIAAMVV